MNDLTLYSLIFIMGFYILTKAADYFIEEAANLGKIFGMSKLMIGLTIVAIGTSLPETLASLGSILFTDNYSEFIIGTTLGSNITNILLAFGIFMIVSGKFYIKKKETFNVLAFYITSVVFLEFILLGFVNYVAIALVIFYGFYLYYSKRYQRYEIQILEEEVVENRTHSAKKSYIILVLAFIGLFIGAKLTVDSIEQIGLILQIPAAFLTLTSVSVATSLPEIAVTISSAKRKEYLIAIGNIIGTNVMNICLIIGMSGFLGNYEVQTELFLKAVIFSFIATTLMSYLVLKKKFTPKWGYLFLVMYVIFLVSTFV